jgi:UDP-N-acetylglucosamine--N-acetylmuramyl-(pentapeptide) pyrophosphoryl-undecaprenol N-acetylglucosamine transferase
MNSMNVLLVAGGSGGHLVPAMALADHLRPDSRCFLMSTRRPVDQILWAEGSRTLQWETVGLQPFTPVWRWFSPPYVARQLRAAAQIRSVIRRSQPDVVVGFGGYLSAVGVIAARGEGIPCVIHEQNVIPGRANRWLSRVADAVAVSFPETVRFLPKNASVETTGNPLRLRAGALGAAEPRAEFGLNAEQPVLLVMGGSQGSQTVNKTVAQMWRRTPARLRDRVQVIHLAGAHGVSEVEQAYRRLGMPAKVFPFLHRMELALSVATLAISRAGATGIAEMAAMGVPSILIPYPHAGRHQRANAQWAREIGGAIMLEERELSPDRLRFEMERLLFDPERLERMRRALQSHSDGAAAQRLGDLVRKIAKT